MRDNSLTSPFETVAARTIFADAPADLCALRFRQRSSERGSIRICAVGDVGFHGRARGDGDARGYARRFEEIAPLLHTAQIGLANLECVITDAPADAGRFSGPPDAAPALAQSGFTLLHLANNHIYDYGAPGCGSTIRAVEAAGMKVLGAGNTPEAARQMLRTDAGGLRIGWLGCGRTLQAQAAAGPCFWELDGDEFVAAVRRCRPEVDFLVASLHAGYEYIEVPSPEHKALAERCVSEGASLVLLHHAHVVQGVQVLNGKEIICYGLGNLLFDSSGGYVEIDLLREERFRGAVFVFDVDARGICLAAAIPVRVGDDFAVHWDRGPQGVQAIEHLGRLSGLLEGDVAATFQRQRAQRNVGPALTVLWFHLRRGHWSIVAGLLRRVRWANLRMLLTWLRRK